LAAAVLALAAEDARKGSEEARAWLLEVGTTWLDWLGLDIHPDRLQAALDGPKPKAKRAYPKRRASKGHQTAIKAPSG